MNALYKSQLAMASDLAKNRQYDEALVALKAMIEAHGEDELIVGMLASLYFQIGLLELARENYQRVISMNPDNALASFQLGLVYSAEGEHQRALDIWLPITENEEDFMARFHCGATLLELERFDEAMEFLNAAKQTMPQSHPLWQTLKEMLDRMEVQPYE